LEFEKSPLDDFTARNQTSIESSEIFSQHNYGLYQDDGALKNDGDGDNSQVVFQNRKSVSTLMQNQSYSNDNDSKKLFSSVAPKFLVPPPLFTGNNQNLTDPSPSSIAVSYYYYIF
jgi:hypothetical protein